MTVYRACRREAGRSPRANMRSEMEAKHDWLKISRPVDQVPAIILAIMPDCLAAFRRAGSPSGAAMFARSKNGIVTDLYFTPAMVEIGRAIIEPYAPEPVAAPARNAELAILIGKGNPFVMLV